MKSLITFLIRKIKNPNFSFDPNMTNYLVLLLLIRKFIYLLRGMRLLFYFKAPQLIFLGKGVSFFNIRNILFGQTVNIDDYAYLSALGEGKIILGNGVNIGAFSRLIITTSFSNLGKSIIIEDNVGVGEFSCIGGAGGVQIGHDTIIGQYLSIHPENHKFDDLELPIRYQGVTRKGIKIGCNCWIGAKVTFLDGSSIGNGCVVAAGSVVTKNFGDNVVIAGIPAKIIKYRCEEKDIKKD